MIEFKNVTYSYNGEAENLPNISLSIPDGQVIVLCGESGCGKTTLTRLINGLIPHYYEGTLSGSVLVNGLSVAETPLYELSKYVGSVFQNPRSQFFNVDTTSEITFGCENLGMDPEKIRERLQTVTEQFQLQELLDRSIFHLSGGQKQKIACASVSMPYPDIYVLDEPSSNLDADSVHMLSDIIRMWKSQGKTVVISEHRLYYLKGIANRYLYLQQGTVCQDFSAAQFEAMSDQERYALGLRTLHTYSMDASLLKAADRSQSPVRAGTAISGSSASSEAPKILLKDFLFSYKNGEQILHIDKASLSAGSVTAIIGKNGAGKSTFARCLCGLEKKCGQIIMKEKAWNAKDRLNLCYEVMQDVNHQLFTDSVDEEIRISMPVEDDTVIDEILHKLDLYPLKEKHPMSLSGGQKQRVAIASALAADKEILIFDEPTSGLDYRHMLQVADTLRSLQAMGKSVYVITHDAELIMSCCTSMIEIEKGTVKVYS